MISTALPPKDIPLAALALGIAGLLPFAGLAVQVATGWPMGPRLTGPALYALLIYAAIIVSFLGGAQWGLAVAAHGGSDEWRRYGAAVLPSLAGWLGLWIGGKSGLLLLSAAFCVLLGYDMWTIARGEGPAWYGRLRVRLTAGVVASLVVAALFGPF
jgi:hypothetical protein